MKQLFISYRITHRDSQSFNQYLKEVAEIETLTLEEEKFWTLKACKGDRDAINELVRRNLRFVVSVAKQYVTPQNPLEDLVNEGNIGLILAAENFKPEMGFKFISYAVWWIRKVIFEHLTRNGRLIRLPANKVDALSKLEKKLTKLEQKIGRPVSVQELIHDMDNNLSDEEKVEFKKIISDYEVLDILNNYTMDSLDRNINNEDGNETSVGDLIIDSSFEMADELLIKDDTKVELNKLLETLKPRDKQVISALFGLDGKYPKTLKDIAEELGLTREAVRQIREKSLKKLNKKIKKTSLNR